LPTPHLRIPTSKGLNARTSASTRRRTLVPEPVRKDSRGARQPPPPIPEDIHITPASRAGTPISEFPLQNCLSTLGPLPTRHWTRRENCGLEAPKRRTCADPRKRFVERHDAFVCVRTESSSGCT